MLAIEMLLLAARDAARGDVSAQRWLKGEEQGRLSVVTCLEMAGIEERSVSYEKLRRLARRFICRREIIRNTRQQTTAL